MPVEDRGVPEDLFAEMVAFRRDLHRHPELSNEEARTSLRVAQALTSMGLSVRTGVGGHGVVAEIGTGAPPVVALRADMDALPIEERTGLPFSSEVPGVMHACGHDGHTSMLLGATRLLLADPPPYTIRLIFQPAEERGDGALGMIEDGVLDGVAVIFGGHLDVNHLPGRLVVTDGAVNASTDTFTIEVQGRAGHGARPHEARDAVLCASQIVVALQQIVAREVAPGEPAVVTVGSFHAGSAPNVIAGTALLEGTIRALSRELRPRLRDDVTRVATALGQAAGAQVAVRHSLGAPALLNHPGATEIARDAARRVVGPERVEKLPTWNLGGEDFAHYVERIPGSYIRFGARIEDRERFPAHSGRFDFHEDALAAGARWFHAVAHEAGRFIR